MRILTSITHVELTMIKLFNLCTKCTSWMIFKFFTNSIFFLTGYRKNVFSAVLRFFCYTFT